MHHPVSPSDAGLDRAAGGRPGGGGRGGATASAGSGSRVVVGLVALGVVAGATAIAYQRGQTGGCLTFYGTEAARRVADAPQVEVWTLAPDGRPGTLRATARRDVSNAPGLVHLRRGLVEDANFRWTSDAARSPGRLPAEAWDVALVFADPARPGPPTILVIDTGAAGTPGTGEGWIAVVGRKGRIGLGRIGGGLRKWLDDQPPER